MFITKRIEDMVKKLELRVGIMEGCVKMCQLEMESLRNRPNPIIPETVDVNKLMNDIEARLLAFHKEITDKYFNSMDSFMRYSREVSLIETLAGQVKDSDLFKLQTALMQPIIKQRNEAERKSIAEEIEKVGAGEEILKRREELHAQFLDYEKRRMDTKDLSSKLEELDWVIEKAKHA